MQLTISTKGYNDIIDLTPQVNQFVVQEKIKEGAILVFVSGSTAAVTTIEYESGVIEDLRKILEKIIPQNTEYAHNQKWGDGNGYAHLRAALLKPSLTVPVINNRLQLGTWQQIVLIDFDNRPRERTLIIQALPK